jgi:hypothetical protein
VPGVVTDIRVAGQRSRAQMALNIGRSLGLAILLAGLFAGSVAGQTVRERLRDPSLRVYSVVFGIVVGRDATVEAFRVAKVTDPKSGSVRALPVDVPDEFVQAARRKVESKRYPPRLEDGKPVEFFTYFYYMPTQPGTVITDLDRPLENQP